MSPKIDPKRKKLQLDLDNLVSNDDFKCTIIPVNIKDVENIKEVLKKWSSYIHQHKDDPKRKEHTFNFQFDVKNSKGETIDTFHRQDFFTHIIKKHPTLKPNILEFAQSIDPPFYIMHDTPLGLEGLSLLARKDATYIEAFEELFLKAKKPENVDEINFFISLSTCFDNLIEEKKNTKKIMQLYANCYTKMGNCAGDVFPEKISPQLFDVFMKTLVEKEFDFSMEIKKTKDAPEYLDELSGLEYLIDKIFLDQTGKYDDAYWEKMEELHDNFNNAIHQNKVPTYKKLAEGNIKLQMALGGDMTTIIKQKIKKLRSFEDEEEKADFVLKNKGFFNKILKTHTDLAAKYANAIGYISSYGEILGTYEAKQLALKDKKYIPNFINILSEIDLDHEVQEPEFIEEVLDRWKWCEETLELAVGRCTYLSGQQAADQIAPYAGSMDEKTFNRFLEKIVTSVYDFPNVSSRRKINLDRDIIHFNFVLNAAVPEVEEKILVERFNDAIHFKTMPTYDYLLNGSKEVTEKKEALLKAKAKKDKAILNPDLDTKVISTILATLEPKERSSFTYFEVLVNKTKCSYGPKKYNGGATERVNGKTKLLKTEFIDIDKKKKPTEKTFDTFEACQQFAQQLIQEKKKEGYVIYPQAKHRIRFEVATEKKDEKALKEVIQNNMLLRNYHNPDWFFGSLNIGKLEPFLWCVDNYYELHDKILNQYQQWGKDYRWSLVKIFPYGSMLVRHMFSDYLSFLADKGYKMTYGDAEHLMERVRVDVAKKLFTKENRMFLPIQRIFDELIENKDNDEQNFPLFEFLIELEPELNLLFPVGDDVPAVWVHYEDAQKQLPKYRDSEPLLHKAVRQNMPLSIIKKLIEHGANPTLTYTNWKVLEPDADRWEKEIMTEKEKNQYKGKSSFDILLRHAQTEEVKAYLIQAEKDWKKQTYVSDILASPKILKQYLDDGGDPNQKDKYGVALLHHMATRLPQKTLIDHNFLQFEKDKQPYFPEAYKSEMLMLLLEAGADPNIEDNNGQTPLFYMQSWCGKCLVEAGADLFHKDHKGDTPLFFHLQYQPCNGSGFMFYEDRDETIKKAMIYQLLTLGVELNHKDKEGKTFLEHIHKLRYYRDFIEKIKKDFKIKGDLKYRPWGR